MSSTPNHAARKFEIHEKLTNASTSRNVLLNFREDGVTPFFTVWKHGLREMKV